jgi:acyl-CoA synthetase (NDP forming)
VALTAARRSNLRRLLAPRSVAFVGGGDLAGAVEVCDRLGFDGPVWGVNPKRSTLGGRACFPSVADLPSPPDAVFVAVPAEATIGVVADLARIGAGGAICYAAGFAEVGAEGAASQAQLVEAAGDLALIGPNCYGVLNLVDGVSMLRIGHGAPRAARGAAFIAQSGNLALNVTMSQRSVPLAYVVSCGNQAQLDIADFMDVLIDDPRVTALGLYIEAIPDVPRFAAIAARASALGKPIVAQKLGASAIGATLALSHTSSLVGSDALCDTLFHRLGVARVHSPAALLETLKLLAVMPPPRGDRLAVFTCSGGDSGTVADLAEPLGIALPQPTEAQHRALRALLPDYVPVNNPLDYNPALWGKEKELTEVFGVMLAEGYDAGLLVIDYPLEASGYQDTVDNAIRALMTASRRAGVPAAITSVFSESVPERARAWMIDAGVAPLQGVEHAVPAMAAAMTHARLRRNPERPAPLQRLAPLPASTVALDERQAKESLAAHGLTVPEGVVATAMDAPAAAARLGFPVVVKALDARLAHKTELGAVVVGLKDEQAVAEAVATMGRSLAAHAPGIDRGRVLVERMVAAPLAELIVGIKRDASFGLALVVGAGGVLVEMMADSATLLLPVARTEVRHAIAGLRVARLLDGFRGRHKADLEAVVDAVMAVAAYAWAMRDRLVELDVNPLMVTASEAVAVDALIRLAEPT